MYKIWFCDGGQMQFEYVEMDPSERYGRSNDVLGKGAMKTVYRAFDEFLAMEVAWNQVKLNEVFRSPEELQRLYSEVHLLKNLNHDSIMRFRASWIDVDRRTFNFITEMFTSGTLREYRKRYPRVNIRAIKDWARQILEGLDHLHCHDPPIIHRDLKCDNIFVNGHIGQVKIGDLGLAAILHGAQHAHSVIGTPEFMAPELYEEDYDELVDIYSFGMCVLEMLTSEYPYSECSNPAQIYKKVTSGKLPEAFYRIHDLEARRFVGRCLERAPNRPSARELLMDPFLSIEKVKELPPNRSLSCETSISLKFRADMTITGTMNAEDDTIFLKVQISDKTGDAQNVYFPFDIASDTALDVATEMVKELDITDWEPHEIADMIDDEVSALVPSWKSSDDHHPPMQLQHSFEYEDDEDDNDDNTPRNPFYCNSSNSSSHASLAGLFSPRAASAAQICPERNLYRWLEEERKIHDDASSQASLCCSDKYLDTSYSCTAHEDHRHISNSHKEPHHWTKKSSSRFCPEKYRARNCDNNYIDVGGHCCSKHQKRMVRSGSLVDIRSQLLHQKLTEEINKRRMFKTVGAVEHIGYRDPGEFFRGGSSCVIQENRIARFK